MAIRYVSVTAAGVVSESLNDQAALIAAADTANSGAGSNARIASQLTAITANQPTGAVVVSVDLSAVTTKNALRRLLDLAVAHVVNSTNLVT